MTDLGIPDYPEYTLTLVPECTISAGDDEIPTAAIRVLTLIDGDEAAVIVPLPPDRPWEALLKCGPDVHHAIGLSFERLIADRRAIHEEWTD